MSSVQPVSSPKQITHDARIDHGKKPLFQRIIRKIIEIAQAIWKLIAFWKESESELTEREVNLINISRRNKETDKSSLTTSLSSTDDRTLSSTHTFTRKTVHPLERRTFDPSIENIRAFSRTTANLATENLYEERVAPIVAKVQEAVENIDHLEHFTKLILQLGDKAASSFFDKFPDYKENVNSSFIQVLEWLTQHNEEGINYHDLFQERLQSQQGENALLLADGEELDHYIEPIMEWVFDSDHNKTLAELVEELQLQEETFDIAFQEMLSLLVENKLEHYIEALKTNLETDFPEIIQEMMQLNANKMAGILSGRFGELIENAEYSQVFERIKQLCAHHLEDYIEGSKAHHDLMEKVHSGDGEDYRSIIEEDGEDIALARAFCMAYEERENQYPRLYDMITPIGNQDLKAHREYREHLLYGELTKRVYHLMFPREILPGQSEPSDGIEALWGQVETTERFDRLIEDGAQIVADLFPEDMTPFVEQLKAPFLTLSRTFFVSLAKKEIESTITLGIQKMFEMVVDSARLDEIAAENAFPRLNENLLSSFIEIILDKELLSFAGLFKSLTDAADDDQEEIRAQIINLLFDKVNTAAQETNIGRELFNKEANLIISRIEEFLTGVSASLKTTTKIKATITEFLDGDKGIETDATYGEMISKLLFDVGAFEMDSYFANKAVQWFKGTIKGKISHSFTRAMESFRVDHQKFLSNMLSVIKTNYSTKEQVYDLLFGEPRQPRNVEEELAAEMLKTSKLFHDILHNSLKEMPVPLIGGFIGSIATRYTPSVSKLNQLIGTIYDKILGNSCINEHLLIEMQEVVLSELERSARKIETSRALQATPVQAVA